MYVCVYVYLFMCMYFCMYGDVRTCVCVCYGGGGVGPYVAHFSFETYVMYIDADLS